MSRRRSSPSQAGARAARQPRDPQLVREELLRPNPWLGYDRDRLGCYFIGRGALELAESQLRRAVWLNPFEPAFQVHWAVSLLGLGRAAAARVLLHTVLTGNPSDREALAIWRRTWPTETPPGAAGGSAARTENAPHPGPGHSARHVGGPGRGASR